MTILRWGLVFGLFWVFTVFALALIGLALEAQRLMEHAIIAAVIIALLATVAAIAVRRPRGHQTSYCQPVRITKLRRKFLSGEVTGIRFSFSNGQFASEFTSINGPAIASGVVETS